MKIHFIGAGSAFNKTESQSNAIVISDTGKKLLIDCGSYFWFTAQKTLKMMKDGIFLGEVYRFNDALKDICKNNGISIVETSETTVLSIDALYVSHLHADHIGGIEELAFCTFFNPSAPKPKLYGNFKLLHDLWESSLRGGLESIQAKQMNLDAYFEVCRIPDNGQFIWEDILFKPVQTVHVVNDCTIKISYGLLIQNGMRWANQEKNEIESIGDSQPVVFFTTDTQFCPNQISDFYAWADIIFHDAENTPFKSGVHAHYDDLKTLDPSVKAKMIPYHYQIGMDRESVVADGFMDVAKADSVFDISWDALENAKNHS